jgi:hypothetical protein
MGLEDVANADAKLAALRKGGITRDTPGGRGQLIYEYELRVAASVAADHAAKQAHAGRPGTVFSAELVQHTLFGEVQGGTVAGGHRTSTLQELAQRHPRLCIREVASKAAAGTTWHKFELYFWLEGNATPKERSQVPLGDAYAFDPAKWRKEPLPKTTADDFAGFMTEVDGAWSTWLSQHNGEPGSVDGAAKTGSEFKAPGPSGVIVMGHYAPTTSPPGAGGKTTTVYTFNTAYAHESWF